MKFAITLAVTMSNLGGGVADAGTDACARGCSSTSRPRYGAGNPCPSACSTTLFGATAWHSTGCWIGSVLTLLVATATVALTAWLYIVIPKGFFPVQDTGVIEGITQASQSISFDAMAQHQQALAAAIMKDPDVVSLSSFIGVDGSNVTLNSGRFLINLKPHDDRSLTAAEIIRRIETEVAGVTGITLYMQPVQDLTIDTTVSATQYQFVLEDANLAEFQTWVPETYRPAQANTRHHRCGERPAAEWAGRRHYYRPRHGGAFRHHAGRRWTVPCTMRSDSASSQPSSRSPTSTV